MANDDRQSQHFIREVDEEMRRAQLKSIWDRFAPLIIAVCVLVVLVTAGYRGWLWWQERQAAQAGDQFLAAVELLQGDNRAEGEAALAAIAAEGGGGYPVLAQLRLAGEKAAAGQKAEALAAYDAVAGDSSVADTFRGLATIRAALLALDTGDTAGATQRSTPLNESGNAWRHSAREVLGTAAYQSGDLDAARNYFSQIQEDAETPPDLWVRAGMMVALIDGQTPAPGASPAEPPPAPAPAAPVEPAPAAAAPVAEPPAADFEAAEPPPVAQDLAPPPPAAPAPQPAAAQVPQPAAEPPAAPVVAPAPDGAAPFPAAAQPAADPSAAEPADPAPAPVPAPPPAPAAAPAPASPPASPPSPAAPPRPEPPPVAAPQPAIPPQ